MNKPYIIYNKYYYNYKYIKIYMITISIILVKLN